MKRVIILVIIVMISILTIFIIKNNFNEGSVFLEYKYDIGDSALSYLDNIIKIKINDDSKVKLIYGHNEKNVEIIKIDEEEKENLKEYIYQNIDKANNAKNQFVFDGKHKYLTIFINDEKYEFVGDIIKDEFFINVQHKINEILGKEINKFESKNVKKLGSDKNEWKYKSNSVWENNVLMLEKNIGMML